MSATRRPRSAIVSLSLFSALLSLLAFLVVQGSAFVSAQESGRLSTEWAALESERETLLAKIEAAFTRPEPDAGLLEDLRLRLDQIDRLLAEAESRLSSASTTNAREDDKRDQKIKDLEKKYGIKIPKRGKDKTPIVNSHGNATKATKDSIVAKEFTQKELDMLEEVLEKLSKMGIDLSKRNLQFVRTDQGIDDNGKKNRGIYGATYDTGESIAIFDLANWDRGEFSDAEKEFKGTVGHELGHASLQYFDPATGKKYDASNFEKNPVVKKFMEYTGWTDATTYDRKREAKGNTPPTNYAATLLREDLSESFGWYLVDPEGLRKKSPRRYEFFHEWLPKYAPSSKNGGK